MHFNLIGKTFNRLTILSTYKKGDRIFAECSCSCGKIHNGRLDHVKNRKCKSCGCFLTEKNKENKKYKYNEDLFLSNSNDMYYILGLFYSDGSLAYNRNRFEISLKAGDKDLLEKVSKLIKNDSQLFYNKNSNSYKLLGDSQKIYQQLLFHGLTPKKSKTIVIKKELSENSHFWRGMIDGDGSVLISKGNLLMCLCGTIDVCSEFKKFCSKYTNLKNNVHIRKDMLNFANFRMNGNKAFKILNVIYQDKGNLFLNRKYENFTKMYNKYGT